MINTILRQPWTLSQGHVNTDVSEVMFGFSTVLFRFLDRTLGHHRNGDYVTHGDLEGEEKHFVTETKKDKGVHFTYNIIQN